jgi:transcriptional regulator with XRE-family HTH domain
MEKKLNISTITNKMLQLGLSQTDLANKMNITKSTISSWLKPEKFPRPRHLLQLAEMLDLKFDQILIPSDDDLDAMSPLIAFRKNGNHVITNEHEDHIIFIGNLLQRLIPYLPFDQLSMPSYLSSPKVDYEYIQKVAKSVRNEANINHEIIRFEDLIEIFNKLKIVIIPVLWGKKHYKNDVHVFLPESQTTWVFINLDIKLHDFKFFISHELGHVKSPLLPKQNRDIFADAFAGALLFPSELAKVAYQELIKIDDRQYQIEIIKCLAIKHEISPITVYKEVQSYARHFSLRELNLEEDKLIYRIASTFKKKDKSKGEILLGSTEVDPKQYLQGVKSYFETCFFDCLAAYLKEHQIDASKFISNVMDISFGDACALWQELKV